MARSSVRTISVVNRLGQQRHPLVPRNAERTAFLHGHRAVKVQVFPKGLRGSASASSSPLSVPGQASAADRPFSHGVSTGGFWPRTDFHRADWTRVDKLVFRHPFLPGKPVFRGEKSRGMRAPQPIQCGTPGQLFFVYSVFEREPRQIVVHGLTGVAGPRGEQLLRHIVPEPLVHEADDAVHVEIRLAVRTASPETVVRICSRRRRSRPD